MLVLVPVSWDRRSVIIQAMTHTPKFYRKLPLFNFIFSTKSKEMVLSLSHVVVHRNGLGMIDSLFEKILWVVTKHFFT